MGTNGKSLEAEFPAKTSPVERQLILIAKLTHRASRTAQFSACVCWKQWDGAQYAAYTTLSQNVECSTLPQGCPAGAFFFFEAKDRSLGRPSVPAVNCQPTAVTHQLPAINGPNFVHRAPDDTECCQSSHRCLFQPAVIVPHAHWEAYRRGSFPLHILVSDSANPPYVSHPLPQ